MVVTDFLPAGSVFTIDGTDYRLKQPIFIRKVHTANHLFVSSAKETITYKPYELKGFRKILYRILNRFGKYSRQSNKDLVQQLRGYGVIK